MANISETSKAQLASSAGSAETISQATPGKSRDATREADDAHQQRSSFMSVAFGMSWQLAVIVLLPIIGGYKVDAAAHSTPLWTLIGLALALGGSIYVVKRSLAAFGNFTVVDAHPASSGPAAESTADTEYGNQKEQTR